MPTHLQCPATMRARRSSFPRRAFARSALTACVAVGALWSGPAGAFGTPATDCNKTGSTHLVYNGGTLMSGVTLVPVFFGTPGAGSAMQTDVMNFLSFMGTSSFPLWAMPQLEYRMAQIKSVNSTVLTLQPSDLQDQYYDNSLGVSNIANEVAWQVEHPSTKGFPTGLTLADTIFVVYVAPPFQPPTFSGGGFCTGNPGTTGYNTAPQPASWVTGWPQNQGIHMAIVADRTDDTIYKNCFLSSNANTAMQSNPYSPPSVLFHEISESLSGSWAPPSAEQTGTCNQIADICQNNPTIPVANGSLTYPMQPLWSNNANACVGAKPGAAGDIVGNGTADVAFGGTGTSSFPVAVPDPTVGQFDLTNLFINDDFDLNGTPTAFASWASQAPYPLVGDFDGDGFADVALTGVHGWASIPVGYSEGPGLILAVTNSSISGQPFASFTSGGSLPPVVGDFDGDGRADIAATGGPGWNTVPIAYSNGRASCSGTTTFGSVLVNCTESASSSFTATNNGGANSPQATFNQYIANSKQSQPPQLVAGDFNGDGLTDLALVGGRAALTSGQYTGTPWTNVVVAINTATGGSRAGTFSVSTWTLSDTDFGSWSAGSLAVAEDINGDGFTDIVLSGGNGWNTIPVAFSTGNGSFTVENLSDQGVNGATRFSSLTSQSGVQLFAGDWNGNGYAEIAAWNGGWTTMPAANYELFGWDDYDFSFNLGFAGALGTSVSQTRYWSVY
jgi:hypothetical protein